MDAAVEKSEVKYVWEWFQNKMGEGEILMKQDWPEVVHSYAQLVDEHIEDSLHFSIYFSAQGGFITLSHLLLLLHTFELFHNKK